VVSPYLAAWPDVDVDVKQKFQFGGIGVLFAYEIYLLITPDPLFKPGLRSGFHSVNTPFMGGGLQLP
jgi:LysR family transcriptional regulator for metE and metH